MATVVLNVPYVRQWMDQQGWSERQMAQQMGIAYSYVNRLLTGQRNVGPHAIAGLAIIGIDWHLALRVVIEESPSTHYPSDV